MSRKERGGDYIQLCCCFYSFLSFLRTASFPFSTHQQQHNCCYLLFPVFPHFSLFLLLNNAVGAVLQNIRGLSPKSGDGKGGGGISGRPGAAQRQLKHKNTQQEKTSKNNRPTHRLRPLAVFFILLFDPSMKAQTNVRNWRNKRNNRRRKRSSLVCNLATATALSHCALSPSTDFPFYTTPEERRDETRERDCTTRKIETVFCVSFFLFLSLLLLLGFCGYLCTPMDQCVRRLCGGGYLSFPLSSLRARRGIIKR